MGTVLVVDPSLMDRSRMSNVLEAAGHEVVLLSSPEEAIARLHGKRGTADLILSELVFPTGSGRDLVEWARGQESWKRIPILLVTPQPPREQLIDLIASGATTVISKPFGPDMLLRRVTEALAESSALGQGEGESLSWQIGDYLRRQLKRSERTGSPFSAVLCRVKGPNPADLVPPLLGGLVHIMRESDVLARFGEEHVLVLLPDTDSAGTQVVLGRIARVVADLRSPSADRPPLALDLSTGTATYPGEVASAESLIELAMERCGQ